MPALLALACVLALASPVAAPAQSGQGAPAQSAEKAPAFAKDTTPLPPAVTGAGGDAAGEAAGGGSGGGALVRIVVGLGVVLAVVYGIYWLLKAYARSKGGVKTERDGRIEVVATTTLAPSRALHLVRVGGDVVLVGATDQGITPVRTWSGEDARRLAPLLDPPAPPGPGAGAGGTGSLVDGLRRRTVRG